MGTCVKRAVGSLPRGGAAGCPFEDPRTCGLTGLCDGQGGCELYAADTLCQPSACVDGVTVQLASVCDGRGICVVGAVTTCTPYTCSEGACAVDDCQFDPADCPPRGNRDASLD